MKRTIAVGGLWVMLAAGCGGGGGSSGSCSASDVPSACPNSGAPRFSSQVQPILSADCGGCHSSYASYSSASAQQSSIKSKVGDCSMPPDSALSAQDRMTVLDWIVCGAPNN